MKKYTKPEIKVNYFETEDVITTSCTCPDTCAHHFGTNVFGEKTVYFHTPLNLWGCSNIELDVWANYYDTSNAKLAGTCEEHGDFYKIKLRN